MSSQQAPFETEDRTADAAEYTGGGTHRQHGRAAHVSSRGLRVAYFSVAAVWGFIIGVAGLLVTLQVEGQVVRPGLDAVLYLVLALAIAVGGGFVIAGAYQEAKRRRR